MNKKSQSLALKIIGAAVGSTGFIVLALGTSNISNLTGVALTGIGALLIAAGGYM